ncbi:MAG: 1-acyl-sn-glycerol-3-phosphate acyltransferase [Sphaerochaetaceae bacterium]|nr:1-acyl-sn-glycerol-3-phosphate acyltransferase [Sphaerochaetaceae bacterium]
MINASYSEDFREIGPYEGEDFDQAVARLREYPQLINNFTDILSRHNRIVNKWKSFHSKNLLKSELTTVKNYDEFQKRITSDIFLNLIESSSIDEFTFDGLEEVGTDKPHIFISNHRDIVLDTALLDLALYRTSKGTLCQMVIGDNLLVNQFATDMFKVNGAITVKRTANSAAELKEETLRLSRYLMYALLKENTSVWIAQKSGRSKDGLDITSPAILKMIYLSAREQKISFSDFLREVSIVPVAISYQYDPCDVSKGQSEIRKLKAEGVYNVYKKKKYQDILELIRGLRLNKGNVHIQVGQSLDSSITNPVDAAREIDRQIHLNYKLWDTNYYCWDRVHNTSVFADKYKDMNTKYFTKKYRKFNREVVEYVYKEYANPVQSYLDAKNES